jgi:hypothetical protein
MYHVLSLGFRDQRLDATESVPGKRLSARWIHRSSTPSFIPKTLRHL